MVLPGGEVHFLLPFLFPQRLGETPRHSPWAFPQPEGGNHLHSVLSFPAVERARPAKMQGLKAGGWRAAGMSGEGEAAALGCEAGEGFPHSCLGLWEAGSRQDGAPKGGERHPTAANPVQLTRTSTCPKGSTPYRKPPNPTPHPPSATEPSPRAASREEARVRVGT